ncbi:MAG TPA: efflux RND transporter periplasmic adaptor subunit [Baekduia sp.]|nr:efflux RND transporter periplasmic adaptor subunit [Baekduia sp.]
MTLLAAAALLGGCGDRERVEYQSEPVAVGDIRDVVPAVGRLKPKTSVEVRAVATGRVEAVLVEPNAVVRAGDPLARIATADAAVDVREARADREARAAALAETRVIEAESLRALANREKLVARGLYSQASVEALRAQAAAAAAAVRRSEAELRAAEARFDRARQGVSVRLVRSPISGVVLSGTVAVGETVSPTDARPMYVVADTMGAMTLEAEVPEADIARVSQDMRVTFAIEAHPGVTFVGRVAAILRQPIQDGAFVAYPVRIEVDNGDGRLLPGMTASIEFVQSETRQVLRAPIAALYFTPRDYVFDPPARLKRDLVARGLTSPELYNAAEMGVLFASGRRRVFVERDGRWVRREIRVGAQSRDHFQVLDGLKAGDRVIVSEASR